MPRVTSNRRQRSAAANIRHSYQEKRKTQNNVAGTKELSSRKKLLLTY